MAVKLPATAEPMANFAVAYAEHIAFDDEETLQEKYDNGQLGGEGAGYKQLSQAEYDALTEDEKMNGKEYRTYDTGHIYKLGVEYGKDADLSETLVTYVSIGDLNTRKGLSISLVANEDNTQQIIDALESREQFVEWFGNSNNRFGINPKTYGDRINELRIIKTTETNAIITAIMNSGAVLSRLYTGGTLGDWTSTGHILTDGYMDDGTISITGQNEDSSGMYGNGVLPETLGFTRDAMTWANGIYRISNATDLVGLPDNLQLGRLEHFNLKRWKGNHNPHTKDWAERMSVFYSDNGNIYTRLQISGATAGVVTSDTGWRCVSVLTTELTELGLDGSATIQNVMDKMSIGQHCIINTSRFDDKTQVDNIEYGKLEIRRLSSGMWSLWLEDVLHGNVVAHGTCSAGKFAGWHYFATKTVADVPRKTLAFNESVKATTSNALSQANSYVVRNGICYVSLDITTNAVSTDINTTVNIADGLPAPVQHTSSTATPFGKTSTTGVVYISTTGNLCGRSLISNSRYVLSFSYPVAD